MDMDNISTIEQDFDLAEIINGNKSKIIVNLEFSIRKIFE